MKIGAATACQFTFTFTGGSLTIASAGVIYAHGTTGTPVVDQQSHNAQLPAPTTTDGVTSGSVTLTKTNEQVVCWTVDLSNNQAVGLGTGYTAQLNTSTHLNMESKTVASPTAVAGTWTNVTGTDNFITGAITIYAP
jgi:hypothetical protein